MKKRKLIVCAMCLFIAACTEPVTNESTKSVVEPSSRLNLSLSVSSSNRNAATGGTTGGKVATGGTTGGKVATGGTTGGKVATGSTKGGKVATGGTTGGKVKADDIFVLTSSPTLSIKQVQLCKRIIALGGAEANNSIEILLPDYSFKDFIFRSSEEQLVKKHVNLVCPKDHKTKNAFKIEQVIFPDRILRTLDQHKESNLFMADGKFTSMSVSRGKIAIGKLYLSRFAKFSFND